MCSASVATSVLVLERVENLFFQFYFGSFFTLAAVWEEASLPLVSSVMSVLLPGLSVSTGFKGPVSGHSIYI